MDKLHHWNIGSATVILLHVQFWERKGFKDEDSLLRNSWEHVASNKSFDLKRIFERKSFERSYVIIKVVWLYAVNFRWLKSMQIDRSPSRTKSMTTLLLCVYWRSQQHDSLFCNTGRNQSDSFFSSTERQRMLATDFFWSHYVLYFLMGKNASICDGVSPHREKKKLFLLRLGTASASTAIIYAQWPRAVITGSPSASISVTLSLCSSLYLSRSLLLSLLQLLNNDIMAEGRDTAGKT